MAKADAPFNEQHYMPILKGKAAEFGALSNSTASQRDGFTPLVEVIPGEDDEDPTAIEQALRDGARKLATAWGPADRVIVDTFLVSDTVPLTGGRLAVQFLADELRGHGLISIPVARLGDDPTVLAAVAAVHRTDGRGLCLRLGQDDVIDPGLLASVDSVALATGVSHGEIHVVIDLREVRDATMARLMAHVARGAVNDLASHATWRSLTVASGAFPADLSGLPLGRSDLARHDAAVWRAVAAASPVQTPSYGDYTIAHPLLAVGVAFAPAPQLRYTVDDDWLVWRGNKRSARGSHQFYDHCADLVASGRFFGATLSWGDQYIDRAAASAAGVAQVGPGNATTWRTVGTSHHIALVVNRLTTLGAP